MDRNRKQQILFVTLFVIAIVAAILLRPRGLVVEPNEQDYYNGPRRAKFDPNVWVNADGKIVPAPAGAAPLPANASKPNPGGK